MSKEKFIDPLGQPFEFPHQLLNQISECAPAGFVLFFIDNMGAPQVRATFDHQIMEMGLRSYAMKFLKGISAVEDSGIEENIHQEDEESEE